MDLTPQLFRDVQFRERRGGYDRDDVDEFLARVGTAVGQVQERLREALRRAEAAEARATELDAAAREQGDADETLRRTLVLAQRTADAAVKEAREEAERIVKVARAQVEELRAEAEEALRRELGAVRDQLDAEIAELTEQRRELSTQVVTLRRHIEAERERLVADLGRIQEMVEEPGTFTVSEPEGVETASAARDEGSPADAGVRPEPEMVAGPEVQPEPEPVAQPEPAPSGDVGDEELGELPPPPEDWVGLPAPPPAAQQPSRSLFDPAPEEGPATEPVPVVGSGEGLSTSHLDELRRVLGDESSPEDEADAAMAAFFDQDDEEPGRRFGRRR